MAGFDPPAAFGDQAVAHGLNDRVNRTHIVIAKT